eukprot:m.136678 g.136678  ORF g.136678 m.136678 type:complete len:340 (+) comp17579_c0_seq1:225-1244(+)
MTSSKDPRDWKESISTAMQSLDQNLRQCQTDTTRKMDLADSGLQQEANNAKQSVGASALWDRIASSETVIAQLVATVQLLQEDRAAQENEIQRLKTQVSAVHHRLEERGVELSTETKLDAWKRDFDRKLHTLNEQVATAAHDQQATAASGQAIAALTDELRGLKATYRQEVDQLNAQLSDLRSSLTICQGDIASHTSRMRMVGDACDDCSTTVHTMSAKVRSLTRAVQRGSEDHDSLSAEISCLRKRIKHLEAVRANAENVTPSRPPRNATGSCEPSDGPTFDTLKRQWALRKQSAGPNGTPNTSGDVSALFNDMSLNESAIIARGAYSPAHLLAELRK